MSVLAKAAALVTTKGAVGLAVAFLAVGAAGAATEIANTGSTNPSTWGSQVVSTVRACKAALQPGQHGIGQCVSAFAKTHGKQVSASASRHGRERASDARNEHGKPDNVGKPANPGNSSNAPGGKPATVPPANGS